MGAGTLLAESADCGERPIELQPGSLPETRHAASPPEPTPPCCGSLRSLPGIPSRKAAVASMWDLIRGSLDARYFTCRFNSPDQRSIGCGIVSRTTPTGHAGLFSGGSGAWAAHLRHPAG